MTRFLGQDSALRRLPVALLSGFLGSGKTTLINALLRDPRMAGTAVAVNEFGAVPLDHELIDHGADRTVVLANGCLCCNLAGDMEQAVMRLFSRRQAGDVPAFSRLLIEPSGLSDPAPIMQAILRNPVMSRMFRLEAVVTTVDAVFAEAQWKRHPETRKQVALADQLVITKPDLVDAESLAGLPRLLRRTNQNAGIYVAQQGGADASLLFPATFFSPSAEPSRVARSGFWADDVGDSSHLDRLQSVALTADVALSWQDFDAWLRGIRLEYSEQILRLKGLLNIAGVSGLVEVQGVHHVLSAPVALQRSSGGERQSRLVFIVENLSGEILRDRWRDFLLVNALSVTPLSH
jgi:G3E family GTPase